MYLPPLPARPPLVEGDGYVLRGLRRDAGDTATLRAVFADPDVRAWLWELDGTDEAIDGFVESHEAAWLGGRAADFAVSAGVEGPALALIRLHTFDGPTAKLAWISAPFARGTGVARTGAALAARWAHEALGLTTLFAEIEPDNLPSVRLARGVGFRPTGRPGTGIRPDGIAAPDDLYVLDLGAGPGGPC